MKTKSYLTLLTIVILLGFIITSSGNALNGKQQKNFGNISPSLQINSIPSLINIREKSSSNIEKPAYTGVIYGHTYMSYCWSWNPILFAKVDVGVKKTISTINGFYIISGLSLNKTYTVIGSKDGYHNDIKIVRLTEEIPIIEVNLDLQKKEDYGKEMNIVYFPRLRLARILGRTFSAPFPL